MKNRNCIIIGLIVTFVLMRTFAFSQAKSSIAIVSINSVKMPYTSSQLTDASRNALEKLELYYVIDKYDQAAIAEQKNLKWDNCMSKTCLIEIGNALNSDKVLTGSVENFGNKIIIKFRIIDVKTREIEKFKILEYLDLKDQVHSMIELSLKSLFEMDYDQSLLTKLSEKNAFENTINTPEVETLDLAGPRMGVTVLTGEIARIFSQGN